MAIISKPFTFSANTTMSSSQMNSNFDTLYNDYNGGISAANLATGAVTTAKIANANVTTPKLADGSVAPDKLATGAARSRVNTQEGRSNTGYGALTTAQAVTVDIGANGLALVSISCGFSTNNSAEVTYFSFAVSGANTIATSDNNAIIARAYGSTGTMGQFGRTILLTELTPGSTTFTVQVKNTVGTCQYLNREINVVPL